MPYNQEYEFFQKNNLGQTMGPSVLYTHANNWEDPWNCLGVKYKEVRKTPFSAIWTKIWTLTH